MMESADGSVHAAERYRPLDEILKDADVLHHTLADPIKEVKDHEKARYEKLCLELGMK